MKSNESELSKTYKLGRESRFRTRSLHSTVIITIIIKIGTNFSKFGNKKSLLRSRKSPGILHRLLINYPYLERLLSSPALPSAFSIDIE